MNWHKELTILLTLWDRVPFTLRWMAYAQKVNLPFRVLIADGGADQSVPALFANSANFPRVDYQYVRYPYDATPDDYYAKVLDALKRVETPYVVLADNDDFFMVNGLLRSVEFLATHADFSSARGIIGGVRIAPNSNADELTNIYGGEVSFVRQVYPDKSNLGETAVARVHDYFSCYRANWYDVFRAEQTRRSFQALHDLKTRDLILSQHIPMLLGVIAGKVHIDSSLYLVRQLENPSSCDHIETRQKADLFDRMLLETWSQDFKGFVEIAAAAIAEKDSIPIDRARDEVKRAYRNFIGPNLVYDLQAKLPPARRYRIARNAISYLGPLGPALRKVYPRVQRAISGQQNGRQFIAGDQLSAADSDFQLIRDFLATSPSAAEDPRRTLP